MIVMLRVTLLLLAMTAPAFAQNARPVPDLSIPAAPPAAPPPADGTGNAIGNNSGSGASDELADPKTGCRIVRSDSVPDVGISWSGECYHGLANGIGVLQWFQKGKPIARFEGEIKDGLANGTGKIAYADGSRYEGDWQDGERNGRGTFVFTNGARYVGEFRENKPNGRGA